MKKTITLLPPGSNGLKKYETRSSGKGAKSTLTPSLNKLSSPVKKVSLTNSSSKSIKLKKIKLDSTNVSSLKKNKPKSNSSESMKSEELKLNTTKSTVLKSESNKSELSLSQRGFNLSNSIGPDGNKLSNLDRNFARPNNTTFDLKKAKRVSVIGVFSREAFRNFAKKLAVKLDSGKLIQLVNKKSAKQMDKETSDKLLSIQKTHLNLNNGDFGDHVQKVFDGKHPPHLFAVLEGKEEAETVDFKVQYDDPESETLKGNTIAKAEEIYTYNKKLFTLGLDNDKKQSIAIYIRDNLEEYYKFSEHELDMGDKKLHTVAIDFATKDGEGDDAKMVRFRTLIVHINNDLINGDVNNASSLSNKTHQYFEDYAKKCAESGVIVTAYLGDTNYKQAKYKDTVASIGGQGKGKNTLNPLCGTGTATRSDYMQCISLGNDNEFFATLQPSVGNWISIKDNASMKNETKGNREAYDKNPEAIDHPTTNNYIALKYDLIKMTQSWGEV